MSWEKIFKEKGRFFEKPHEDLPKLVRIFKKAKVKRVLDLGCGSGRHVVYLAKHGFEVYGFDLSKEGIRLAKQWLKEKNLKAKLKVGDMNKKFPYRDKFFDAIICVQVLHHNTARKIKKVISEIYRVLKPSGYLFVTVPKSRNVKFQGKKWKKIGYRTYVPLEGIEKGIPHFYFTKKLIREFFKDFEILDIHLDRYNHYCILMVKGKK